MTEVGRCIFCAQRRQVSREHVLPRWMVKSFDMQGRIVIDSTTRGVTDPVHERSDLFVHLEGKICTSCNNGWLSALERQVKPILEPMVLNQRRMSLDSQQQVLLATWAIKTIFLLELAWLQMYPASRPFTGYTASEAELAWLFSHKTPPPRSRVWIGAFDAENRHATSHISQGLAIRNDGLQSNIPCHLSVASFGFVAFQVFSVDYVAADQYGASEFDVAPPAELREHLETLWPRLAEDLTWPPPYYFNDQQWEQVSTWVGRFAFE